MTYGSRIEEVLSSSTMRLEIVKLTDDGRSEAEEFALRVYKGAYGAELRTFCSELITLSSEAKGIMGCIGINEPVSGELFLERYLDEPVEAALGRAMDCGIERSQIAEIGTLAVRSKGSCRLMMAALAGVLLSRNKKYAVFTAVKSIRNTFASLGVPFVKIARANALKAGSESLWGSYYENDPEIIAVDIDWCVKRLETLVGLYGAGVDGYLISLMDRLFMDGLLLENKFKKAGNF